MNGNTNGNRYGSQARGPHPEGIGSGCGERVVTVRQLRAEGMTAAEIEERCRPGGPWQQVLPRVYLLHEGPPSGGERVRAALLYAAGRDARTHAAMVTGPAALALHGFSCLPPLTGLPRIDVLVDRQRRLRDAGDVAVRRVRELPHPQDVDGVPCAPVARALADAVDALDDIDTVRVLFAEAVREGHCEARAVVRELAAAGLLERPYVRGAMDVLRAEGRAVAEERLYAMVHCHHLPDPVWNVRLTLPGGPPLGGVDAYWPEHAVAVAIDASLDDDGTWSRSARRRERLEALGITVVYVTPEKLRDAMEQQAVVVRTALMSSADRTPAAYVVVTPR
ncbi:hypothetical protein [Streptomyces sp. HPF1205]|uniref:hypothetical protein n=1 Tax=Streptomyces sp. HPF1205 TaxID=2873262 RepID=UPI001CED01ED|nr:hypothetical protein [Streptomyces sp. HPF1205]